MNNKKRCLICLAWMVCLNAGCSTHPVQTKTGLDRVSEYKHLFEGKRIGIIANQTAVNAAGRSIVDLFAELPGCEVKALFAPEHGLWGAEAAGAKVDSLVHPVYGIPVLSLYRTDGKMPKPTPDMLSNIDVLVFDIQDIGARFYTYIWTMALAMEAAAENHCPFVVLDRPNPVAGLSVQGPILDRGFASFVGLYPIPVVHKMTVGELARLFQGEGWLAQGVTTKLSVVPMTGWTHGMPFEQNGLTFIPPSPNMRTLDTARVYPGLCLLEGTNLSEGRGTALPFLQFGAPWLKAKALAQRLTDLNLPGIGFETTRFTPTASKHTGQLCQGLRLHITDRTQIKPFMLGVHIVQEIYTLHESQFQWCGNHFDRLSGTDQIRLAIKDHRPVRELETEWQSQLEEFVKLRQAYLLYKDR